MDCVIECHAPGGPLRVRAAATFLARARGLLFSPPPAARQALLIAPCSSVHTVAMAYCIDVVFLDRAQRIIRVCPALPPGRICFCWSAAAVLELAAGEAGRLGLSEGVRLKLSWSEDDRWKSSKRRSCWSKTTT